MHLAFSQSQRVVTIWSNSKLVGVGRAISDFKMYSSIFDVVVDPDFQGQGIGRLVMTGLIEALKGTRIFLTSTFGNQEFYKQLGFRFHKSALALYPEEMQGSPYPVASYTVPGNLARFKEFDICVANRMDSSGCYLLNSELGYETTESDYSKRFSYLRNHPEHSIIVAKNSKNEIVAWMHMGLRFLLEDDHFAQLAGLVVRSTERSLGLGAHLLKVAEDWSRHHEMKELRLNSSMRRERAHQFYLRNGFENIMTSKMFAKKLH